MPVQAEFIEQGIIVSHWSGQVTYDEIAASQEQGLSASRPYPFVLILYLDKNVRLPIDIQKNRQLSQKSTALSVLVAGESTMASMLSSLGQRLLKDKDFEYFHTLDEAVVRAREILAEHG